MAGKPLTSPVPAGFFGDSWPDLIWSDQIWSDLIRSDQIRSDLIRSGEIWSGQIRSGRIFGPNLASKIHQNLEKSIPRRLPMLIPFFYRFLIDFGSQLGPPEPQKLLKFYLFYCIFCKIGLQSWYRFFIDFWCQLASIFRPKIHQNPSKNRSQEASNFWPFSASSFYRFWLHLGRQNRARTAQDGPKTPPRRPQDRPKRVPKNWSLMGLFEFGGQEAPKTHQDPLKTPPRSIFYRCWCQLASIFRPKIHQNPSKNRSQEVSNF